jgi:hypothetical protein
MERLMVMVMAEDEEITDSDLPDAIRDYVPKPFLNW